MVLYGHFRFRLFGRAVSEKIISQNDLKMLQSRK